MDEEEKKPGSEAGDTEDGPDGDRHDVFKRILVATDFSEHAKEALRIAGVVARACNPENMLILHVFDVSGLPIIQSYPYYYGKVNKAMLDEIRGRAERLLGELAEPYLAKFPQASARLLTGRTVPIIMEAATELNADLIILGVVGLRGGRSGLGTTARKVIRRSYCPVLVAQHREHPAGRRAEDKEEGEGKNRGPTRKQRREERRKKRKERRKKRRFGFRRKKPGKPKAGDLLAAEVHSAEAPGESGAGGEKTERGGEQGKSGRKPRDLD